MNENKPYLVDAVIGNSRLLATLGKTGRLYRLWWPHIDTPQHVDAMRVGIKEANQPVEWIDVPDQDWEHHIAYTPRSNVLEIHAKNDKRKLALESYHFAAIHHDVLIRSYKLTNHHSFTQNFQFVLHSSFMICENPLYNTTMFNFDHDALVHFRKNYYFAIGSCTPCAQFQAGLPFSDATQGILKGNIIDMRPDGSMSWNITLAPGESFILPIFIAAGTSENEALKELSFVKEKGFEALLDETNQYWSTYLEKATPCPIDDALITDLYERSLLMFKLMSDEQTGTIIAAPEFDETFSRCGGYSYCWGRDAAFITTALDKVGLYELTDKFYDWTLTAQSDHGAWQQRHYHDGSLAPSWGLQIDEGASIIWGMWQHFEVKKDMSFAKRVWPAVQKGAQFLLSFIDEKTGLPKPSIDLWEERLASHSYSTAAVYGGLTAASQFAKLLNEARFSEQLLKAANTIKEQLEATSFNEELQCYYRGLNLKVSDIQFEAALKQGNTGYVVEGAKGYKHYILDVDPIVDISLLGLSVPFAAVDAFSERMHSTAQVIEQRLTSPLIKGIKRYEDDVYAGGNPWILTTLWLAHYKLTIGNIDEAKQHIQWAIEHRTEVGLLPEQIDKVTGAPAWVVPLTWSHAMFILAIFMLAEAEAKNNK